MPFGMYVLFSVVQYIVTHDLYITRHGIEKAQESISIYHIDVSKESIDVSQRKCNFVMHCDVWPSRALKLAVLSIGSGWQATC